MQAVSVQQTAFLKSVMGSADNARKNAMTVLQNGNVGIGTLTPSAGLHLVHNDGFIAKGTYGSGVTLTETGVGAKLIWYSRKAAFRVGYVDNNNWNNDSIGNYSFASGFNARAIQDFSAAFGGHTQSRGFNCFAAGWFTLASGDHAIAFGNSTSAKAYASTSLGVLNDNSDDPYAIDPAATDRIFQIGNGDIYTSVRSNAMTVLRNGNTGFGVLDPQQTLSLKGGMVIDQSNLNTGSNNNILSFGSFSGEGIGSKRNAGGNQFGLDFYTAGNNRLNITNSGTVQVVNNLTVQNGKGIIRSNDGTQLKKLSASVTVTGNFNAGETRIFAVTWPENFSAAPEAYVGNVTGGAGGWAEVVMTVFGTNTTGATLYVYNPRTTTVSPNFTIKVIAIGAQ